MKSNPRLPRIAQNWSDAEIDAAVAKPAIQMELSGRDFTAQSKVLERGLRNIFFPDAQVRRVLRTLVSFASGHANSHFPTDEMYFSGLYSEDPWGREMKFATCLTGLAGVGKSEILGAFSRLIGGRSTYDLRGHKGLPVVPLWSMTLANGSGLNQILKEFVRTSVCPGQEVVDGSGVPLSESKDIKPLLKSQWVS